MQRVSCYIDGFNLYHAIDELNYARGGSLAHFKWLCLKSLMATFTDKSQHEITAVKYFSAIQTWMPSKAARHKEYVAALQATGVEIHMGAFKEKQKHCRLCRGTFKGHEEKESDVNFATHLVADAHDDLFDIAYVVTRDSDLAGPLRHIRARFPLKKIRVIAPEWRRHSKELVAIATHSSSIREVHLGACRLAEEYRDAEGNALAKCPAEYAIPSAIAPPIHQ